MVELASLLAAGLFLLGMGGSMLKNAATPTRIYTPDESAFPNAQIGYAPMIHRVYQYHIFFNAFQVTGRNIRRTGISKCLCICNHICQSFHRW